MYPFDIGMGLVLTAIIGGLAGLPPSLSLTLTGLAGAVFPDWDMPTYLVIFRGKLDQWAHRHRDISHYPFLTVPACGLIMGYVCGVWYGVLVAVTMTAHYLRDVLEPGWGIRLFWPFYRKYIFYGSVEGQPRRLHFWTAKEQDRMASHFGNPRWASERKYRPVDAIVLIGGILATVIWYVAS